MGTDRRETGAPLVPLLELDPALGDHLSAADFAQARHHLRAPALQVPRGPWEPAAATYPTVCVHSLSMLLLDGFLVRQVELDGRRWGTLLGPGTLLRPQEDRGGGPLEHRVHWRVTQDTHLAELTERGDLVRCADRTWLLCGEPPQGVVDLRVRAASA